MDSTSVLFAVGEVVKVEAMHKATDMYGPLPYLKFGLTNPVPYDSQQAIYESFFRNLIMPLISWLNLIRLIRVLKPLLNLT